MKFCDNIDGCVPKLPTMVVLVALNKFILVEELMDQLGWYCAHLSTSMKCDKDVDQNILNSFFRAPKPALTGVATIAKSNMAASRYWIVS